MPSKPITCVCEQCGAPFLCRPTSRNGHRGRFCSLACWYEFRCAQRVEHFWARVLKTDGCWLWQASTNRKGYGKVGVQGKHGGWTHAHRYAWELATGTPPGEMAVLHTCDVPGCVRNDEPGTYTVGGQTYERHGHLYLGTRDANNRDTWQKGRSAFQPDWWANRRRISQRGHAIR